MHRFLLLLLIFSVLSCDAQQLAPKKSAFPASVDCDFEAPEAEQTYDALKVRTEAARKQFAAKYEAAGAAERDSLIDTARNYLFEVITTDYFAHWYGTEWDFNGTTRTPGKGKIACGYFITTVLEDAGLKIPRTYWAQQASEYYITRMTSDVKRFSSKPLTEVAHYFDGREDGLYVVGLDNHVGFVVKKDDCLRFVHASYYNPKIGVQSEKLNSDNPLAVSAYRVSGRILGDDMVRKWIVGEQWDN